MSKLRTLVPAAVTLCLVTSACSSSSSGGGTPTDATSPPAVSQAVSRAVSQAPSPSDSSSSGGDVPSHDALAAVVIQQSDLPAGYTGKPADAQDASDHEVDAELAACVGTTSISNDSKAEEVQSDDFSMGDLTVSSDASSYASQDLVDKQVAVLNNPKIEPCLNQVFRKELTKTLAGKATIGDVAFKLIPGSAGGVTNLAGQAGGTVTIKVQGQTAKIYLYIAFITGRQLTGTVSVVNIGQAIPNTLEASLVKAYAARAAKV